MTLKEIVAVLGQSGLFKSIATSRNGIIVENIETKQRSTIPSTVHVSSLEDIAIFTQQEEKPLSQILRDIREKLQGAEIISYKAEPAKIKDFFAEVVPDYDNTRVYFSDMKKVVNWYHILQTHNMLDLIDVKEDEKEQVDGTVKKEKTAKKEKTVKKATSVKVKKAPSAKKTMLKQKVG